MHSGLAPKPLRVSDGIAPAHVDGGPIGRRVVLGRCAGAVFDTALIFGGVHLAGHDRDRAIELDGLYRPVRRSPVAAEVAGGAVNERNGMKLDEARSRCARSAAPRRQQEARSHKHAGECQCGRDLERGDHGNLRDARGLRCRPRRRVSNARPSSRPTGCRAAGCLFAPGSAPAAGPASSGRRSRCPRP